MEGAIWKAIEERDIGALTDLLNSTKERGCEYPGECGYREEDACLYRGDEGACPRVKSWKRGEI